MKNHKVLKLDCKRKRKYTHTLLTIKHQFTQVLMSGWNRSYKTTVLCDKSTWPWPSPFQGQRLPWCWYPRSFFSLVSHDLACFPSHSSTGTVAGGACPWLAKLRVGSVPVASMAPWPACGQRASARGNFISSWGSLGCPKGLMSLSLLCGCSPSSLALSGVLKPLHQCQTGYRVSLMGLQWGLL